MRLKYCMQLGAWVTKGFLINYIQTDYHFYGIAYALQLTLSRVGVIRNSDFLVYVYPYICIYDMYNSTLLCW